MIIRQISVLIALVYVILFGVHTEAASLGKNPSAGLTRGPDGAYYGTTRNGGTFDVGTVFRVDRNGYFTTLINFTGTSGAALGKAPLAPLILATDGKFYGTTSEGGTQNFGTVFRVSISGVIETLHSFTATGDGHYPKGRVVQGADGNFYLQTYEAVDANSAFHPGAIIRVTPNGTEFVLTYLDPDNQDGAFPTAGLTQSRTGLFYGCSFAGGTAGLGAIYRTPPSGGITAVYSFSGEGDGSNPQGEPVEDPIDQRLFYGVTSNGGDFGYGTVYKILDGSSPALASLVSFDRTTQGGNPTSGLTFGRDGQLYGTTSTGGPGGNGTIFRIDPVGGSVSTVLHSFNGTDGSQPNGPLVEDATAAGTFYGTTFRGGEAESGTVFQITSTGQFQRLTDLANPNSPAPPVITSATSASINPNTNFQYQITATGSPTSFGAIGLPAGLTVNSTSGFISGTVTSAGNYSFTITATNAAGTGTSGFRLIVFPTAPSITSLTVVTTQEGAPFSYQISATNFPTSFEATNLPLGLSYDPATGLILGTPLVNGAYDVIITATNNSGTGSAVLRLIITEHTPTGGAQITSPLTANGAVGEPFVYQITANNAGSSGQTFTSSSLPPGLTLDPDSGVISGFPTAAGTYSVILTVISQGVPSQPAATGVIQIIILPEGTPPPPPPVAVTTIQFAQSVFTTNDGVPSVALTVNLQRSAADTATVSVRYATADGTALAGRDYEAQAGTLSFSGSQTEQTIIIRLIAQMNATADRTFSVSLSQISSGVIGGRKSALVVISHPDLSTKVLNVSTRGPVESGEEVMIAGVIILGESPTQVVLRGRGPSLNELGVIGAINDPTLTLFDANGTQLAFNDNYGTNSAADRSVLTNNGLTPTDAREAAIVTTLAPTNYTLLLRGKTNGIGLVEVYDIDRTASSRFANISTRGKVEQGDNGAMIAGFIIAAPADQPGVAQRVVIRATGPSLRNAGLNTALADTTLDLYRGSQLILSNDNWKSNSTADRNEFAAYQLTPADDKEAALVTSLDPGSYSAVVRGKNNTTGVALVEVYQVNQ